MKGILGIDPGLKGALAVVDAAGVIFDPMPIVGGVLDLRGILSWLKAHKEGIEFAYLEKVSSMPKQGVTSVFTFGRGYGAVEALLVALEIPYELVTPQRWQKVMYAGLEGRLEGKARSHMAAARLFPDLDLRASSQSKKPHEGCTEALLIAEYGRRQRLGA